MILTTTSQFEDDDTLSDYLGAELRSSRLALILGSGLSDPFKLPSWDGLVDACCSAVGVTIPSKRPDNRDLAESKSCLPRQECLFGVGSITALCGAKCDNGVADCEPHSFGDCRPRNEFGAGHRQGNVITYNFDDLLELHLSYHGFKIQRVSDIPAWNERADIRILHPHGFLPSPGSAGSRTSWILFDRLSYSQRAAKEPLWLEEQLPILRRNTCLFIGLSNRDDEVDTLIAHVTSSHPYFEAGIPYWGIRFATRSSDRQSDDRASETARKRGLFLKFVADYDNDLPRFLFTVCQKAAGIRMQELGVRQRRAVAQMEDKK